MNEDAVRMKDPPFPAFSGTAVEEIRMVLRAAQTFSCTFSLGGVLRHLMKGLPTTHIADDKGSVYLSRYKIGKSDEGTLYAHEFHRSDADKELHNHPYVGMTLVLGEYTEEFSMLQPDGKMSPVTTMQYKPGDTNLLTLDKFHRIDLKRDSLGNEIPVWTLMCVGHVVRNWGFWNRRTNSFEYSADFFARQKAEADADAARAKGQV